MTNVEKITDLLLSNDKANNVLAAIISNDLDFIACLDSLRAKAKPGGIASIVLQNKTFWLHELPQDRIEIWGYRFEVFLFDKRPEGLHSESLEFQDVNEAALCIKSHLCQLTSTTS